MAIPARNRVFDKIQIAGSIADDELYKALIKDDVDIKESRFNKILLDLEILGLISVSWITKDKKRIEVIDQSQQKDDVEEQNKQAVEKEYEASFPGSDEIQIIEQEEEEK